MDSVLRYGLGDSSSNPGHNFNTPAKGMHPTILLLSYGLIGPFSFGIATSLGEINFWIQAPIKIWLCFASSSCGGMVNTYIILKILMGYKI